jgi:cellobiose phosphorylase
MAYSPGLSRLQRARAVARVQAGGSDESALRAELYSADQMERHGAVLAERHTLARTPGADPLLSRLAENQAVLSYTCETLTAVAGGNRRITPAGEWLLDNHYLIEEQIHTAQRHLPRRYGRELPCLAGGVSDGLPRVYDLALETIAHGDGRVDIESLSRFIAAYQAVRPLALGELWAIPIMLRLALIENLRRVAARVLADWRDRNLAGEWADTMTEVAENDPKSVVLAVADMVRSDPPLSTSFVAELARRLQGQSPMLAMPLTWIEQRLAEHGLSVEYQVHQEAQLQASDQVSISNAICSLRVLAAINWRDFVERMSIVEEVLRQDPACVYATMDFATRDHYRHAVERLARHGAMDEQGVARAALALAASGGNRGDDGAPRTHVGYYLIGAGLRELERVVGYRAAAGSWIQRAIMQAPLVFYAGLIVLLTLALTWPLLRAGAHDGLPPWALVVLAVPGLLATSQLAIGLMNWLTTILMPPDMLPRLDYSHGIPASARTLVVVPSLIASDADVDDLVEGLEVRFLANRDDNLRFALLTDFTDAPQETLPGDAALLRHAHAQVDALNSRYANGRADCFYLLHRPRRYNAADNLWLGQERKRGKLYELNRLLRGHGRDRFALVAGDVEQLGDVRYVITLDTDTQLPRDSARQFVGAMAHPLNRPVFDARLRRVVAGHAILQPRVGVSLPSTARSPYARMFGSDAGIDPYTRMVSDVYQDLFHEGSFIGKGIYDVDAFEQAMDGHFPDNAVLSHDLVEGCYARSGLLSDVQLYEEYPSSYAADVSRRHRWIRGDWQLLPWMLPWIPGRDGWVRNTLSLLSRLKIADNLRRSLAAPALLVLLLAGWAGLAPVLSWTVAVIMLMATLPLLSTLLGLLENSSEVRFVQHLRMAWGTSAQHLGQLLLAIAWLPHETIYSLDAVLRTLWRLLVSRRNLLQWRPSSEVARTATQRLGGLYLLMWEGPVLALAVLAELAWLRPRVLPVTMPFLLLWLVGPVLAWWLGRPRRRAAFVPARAQRRFLRRLARRTWAFFETYVGDEDHWLPPDNVQEQPVAAVAHRTSPTNMGLALLANLTAYDFGYIGMGTLLERCGRTLQTMQGLARYRRHFYNWYDTRTLTPLTPHYVSAVDSGNLAGHLLTLRAGLLTAADDPVFDPRQFEGLADTLSLLVRTDEGRGQRARIDALRAMIAGDIEASPAMLSDAMRVMRRLRVEIDALAAQPGWPQDGEAAFWLAALRRQIAGLLDEFAVDDLDALDALGMPSWRGLASKAIGDEAEPEGVRAMRQRAAARLAELHALAQRAGELAVMDFGFLYDRARDLLAIGYNVDERRLDTGFYDLLASEARLTSFVAIAQGQLPQDGWFTLGRLLTGAGGEPVLLSWSGSMFEYLMPMLVMPSYPGTLLDRTCHAAVARQIEYGHQLGIPWGVSESGYNTFDVHFNYQYRAFGVPGLGLKRGLGEDVVIAPYASVMALMVAPGEACANLKRLSRDGAEGRFGMYEAVDFTPARVPQGQNSVIVSSYMAHHQGMSLLSLAYLLLDQPMQRCFVADPQFRATLLLLQERVPRSTGEYLRAPELPALKLGPDSVDNPLRVIDSPEQPRPSVQLLSNGRYHVMVTHTGGGYSRCRELAVTRWREDATSDHWGMFCYLREVASGHVWSTAYQPVRRQPEHYQAILSEARAEFRVSEREFDSHTEIAVSPEDDIELRRVRITNRGRTRRTIEVTSYGEVVLAPAIADAMHPAFSNLFVQTDWLPAEQAIVCTRRPRAATEQVPWMYHQMAVHDAVVDEISCETDRSRFLGRGRDLAQPRVFDRTEPSLLSGSAGSVLDPIVAIRCRITLDPEQSAIVDMVTGVADTREACLHLVGKYRDRLLADRVFDLAWTHSQVLLRQLNAAPVDARMFERMAASILYAHASLRVPANVLAANRRGQSGLWGQSISGDLPIVLLRIADPANIELVRQMVQAHAYWRIKGLAVDLVVWNEDHAGYRQHLQDLIMGLIASGTDASLIDRPGGIFVRPAQQLSAEDRVLVQSVARVVVSDSRGTLAEQIDRRRLEKPKLPPLLEGLQPRRPEPAPPLDPLVLQYAQPLGGFSADGSEYIIDLAPGQTTPAPWCNVLANPDFGTVVSEAGSAYTWSENAHEFRLTPWENDPVGDGSGEAFYLRDEETGHVWSPSPWPWRGEGAYRVRHGFGYSVFEHVEDGIASELWIYVALDAPVKFWTLKLKNLSGRPRKLTATGYVEWVLGDLRAKSAMHVVCEADAATGTLFARNAYNMEFPERIGLFDADPPLRSLSADRSEFLGRNGNARAPEALRRSRLSGRVGAGLDPCGALQIALELEAGEQKEASFRLGAGRDAKMAGHLVQRFRGNAAAQSALDAVRMHWRWTLSRVQVETPDPGVNLLANGWLMYQTIACRFWARSGYYQSGGAIGFRDQLQDSMAMIHATPYNARQHLLLCAAHQFPEGDVQHWWHPPLDRGVRTQCSDDYLWLPLATSRYVQITADTGVLDEPVGYVEGRQVDPREESYYDLPTRSELREPLYRHCVRAIERSLSLLGPHGLPLIGSGDWNDGMNRVGEEGRGESVWLAFFLHDVLRRFAVTARVHGDEAFAARCESEAELLRGRIEKAAWDGGWYRRGWFDDGTPLGSAANDECRIDSISQSWSVLSGAGDPARSQQAMTAVNRHLVRRDAGLIQLLDPPFDRSGMDPGYIKGYVPGVRENGGQYTHAAIWTVMAFAALGEGARAWELLGLINPLNHARDAASLETYKVEPYVVTADVYAVAPHIGRGGWSWYTGSAGWMYRLIVESLLGFQVQGERMRLSPVLPPDWDGFGLHYRYRETDYHVQLRQSDDMTPGIRVDGVPQDGEWIALIDDGHDHRVDIVWRRTPPKAGTVA